MTRVVLAMLIAAPAAAQIPDTFTNLQTFSEDISRNELMAAMRGFSFALGVRCQHCHVGGPGLDTTDFPSDDKEAKRIARRMIAMVKSINEEHIAELPRADTLTVQCATCHSGVTRPVPIESIVATAIDAGGVDGASARYLELREEFYGSNSYDFSVGPLNRVAEGLLRAGEKQSAVDILELNSQFHDHSVWLSNLLGQAYLANEDQDAARKAFARSLEIDPNDRMAQKELDKLDEKQ